jgi:hypothetical protein
VISAAMCRRLADIEHDLRDLAREIPLAIAGAGAGPELAQRVPALLLDADPVTAAGDLAAANRSNPRMATAGPKLTARPRVPIPD